MSNTSTQKGLWTFILIVCWIIFVGICIEAGAFLTNAIFALAKPSVVSHLWQEVDLSNLQRQDTGNFFVMITIMAIVAILRACLFYLIIKVLHDKTISIAQPFHEKIRRFITRSAGVSLLIAITSGYGIKYAEWLTSQGIKMPDTQALRLGGADVWLFMSIILFIIAQVFKKGIEIRTENDLTI